MYFKTLNILVVSVTLFVSVEAQQLNVQEANRHYNQGMDFYRLKQYAKAVDELETANFFRPKHPRFIYNLAVMYALNGEANECLTLLHRLADYKIFYPIEKDSDFESLFNNATFKEIVKYFYSNLEAISKSEIAFTLDQPDLLTEGIAFDSQTGNFFISSIHKRKVVEYESTGEQHDFIKEKQDGIWGVFGLKVDSKRRLLYACAATIEQSEGIDSSQLGKSGIFIYNLDNAQLVIKVLLDNKNQHLLGDLTIDPEGNIYTTDSKANVIYKLLAGVNKLEKFYTSNDFLSLQGLTISSDGRYLFVADYSTGVHRIDITTKEKILIGSPNDLMFLGIDGLYFYKNSLIGIQNGINPNRVLKMNLNESMNKIKSWVILESNNLLYSEPTLGAIVNNNFYYTANSQWESFTKDGGLSVPESELQKPVILKLKLD